MTARRKPRRARKRASGAEMLLQAVGRRVEGVRAGLLTTDRARADAGLPPLEHERDG